MDKKSAWLDINKLSEDDFTMPGERIPSDAGLADFIRYNVAHFNPTSEENLLSAAGTTGNISRFVPNKTQMKALIEDTVRSLKYNPKLKDDLPMRKSAVVGGKVVPVLDTDKISYFKKYRDFFSAIKNNDNYEEVLNRVLPEMVNDMAAYRVTPEELDNIFHGDIIK